MVVLDDIKSLRVPELKEELKGLGLDIKGNKSELVQRLEDALSKKTQVASPVAGLSEAAALPVPAVLPSDKAINGRTPIQFKTSENGSAPAAAPAPATAAADTSALNENDKRKQRAERFGLPKPEEDKLKDRAERFGLTTKADKQGSAAHKGISALPEAGSEADLGKRKERAKRFGLSIPVTSEEAELKKKARLARFSGTGISTSTTELAKKLEERAKRFAAATSLAAKPAPMAATPAPALTAEQQAKRDARAIKFQPK